MTKQNASGVARETRDEQILMVVAVHIGNRNRVGALTSRIVFTRRLEGAIPVAQQYRRDPMIATAAFAVRYGDIRIVVPV